jgi:hypothetical protein
MKVGRINSSQDGIIHDLEGEISCLSAGHGNVPKIILNEQIHNSIRSGHHPDNQNGGGEFFN